jgi:hypothetical protein
MEAVKDFFGSIGWLLVAFVAGTVIGTPVWNWIKSKLPFGK